MKVTRILGTSLLLLAVASFAYAQPAHRISWNGCDPVVQNMQFAGPITYNLVASAINAPEPNNGHRTKVSIGPDVQDAWRFDSDGCQVGQLTVTFAGASKACLAYQGSNPLPLSLFSYDPVTGKALLDVSNTYDMVAQNAAVRYTLWTAKFNHLFSDFGPQDPLLACGFVENPLCFHTVFTELLLEDGSKIPWVLEDEFVTWQDPNNDTRCPFATQVESSSWGRVKGMYR
jgi:hypothetical protein